MLQRLFARWIARSAADVLAGLYPPETFNQRLVLIAFNSIGLQDRIVTPLGDSLPGSDIHAQVIESLLASHALQRPFWLPWLEIVLLLVIGWGSTKGAIKGAITGAGIGARGGIPGAVAGTIIGGTIGYITGPAD